MKIFLLQLALVVGSSAGFLQYPPPQTDPWGPLAQQATALANQGRYSEAMDVAKRALSVARSQYSDKSLQYALSVNGIGYLELATGDLTEAETDLRRAVSLVISAAGANSVQAITPLANLGDCTFNKLNVNR